MFFKSEISGFRVSDDPNEVNEVCKILRDLDVLEKSPDWGLCKCAVCTQHAAKLSTCKGAVAAAS